MVHVWKLEKWKRYHDAANEKAGLRLHIDNDVDAEVKKACRDFCKWVRTEYDFPIRVSIHVKSSYRVRALYGELVCGTFTEPLNQLTEPHIRIATGDYDECVRDEGKDSALEGILFAIAYQLTHYFQWINDIHLTEIGLTRQAKSYAWRIVDAYAERKEHP